MSEGLNVLHLSPRVSDIRRSPQAYEPEGVNLPVKRGRLDFVREKETPTNIQFASSFVFVGGPGTRLLTLDFSKTLDPDGRGTQKRRMKPATVSIHFETSISSEMNSKHFDITCNRE